MTFPATHNINYYRGDSYEFNVYPRTSDDSDGDGVNDVFPLSGYDVAFTIAEKRGPLESTDEDPILGYAVLSPDRTHIKCAIKADTGATLSASKQYVYDIKITKVDATTYDKVYTIMSGNLTIQDRVEPLPEETILAPGIVQSITTTVTESSVTPSWSANEVGGVPDGYYVYITPYSSAYENPIALQQLVDSLALATPEDVSETTVTLTSTTAIAALSISSVAIEAGTAYLYAIVAYNSAGSSSAAGNFDVELGTIDEVFTDGGS
jgi:hypothetical protein